MSMTSFPQQQARYVDCLHGILKASFAAVGTTTNWTICTANGVTTNSTFYPYADAPATQYRTSASDWGWVVQKPGFYLVELDIQWQAALAAGAETFAFGVNGVQATSSSEPTIRFDAVNEIKACTIRMAQELNYGDVVALGSVTDCSDSDPVGSDCHIKFIYVRELA
jgi:hypothetical protein